MIKSSNELNPNSVNGTPIACSSRSVALGRSLLDQEETVRHLQSDPGLGGDQASPAQNMTGTDHDLDTDMDLNGTSDKKMNSDSGPQTTTTSFSTGTKPKKMRRDNQNKQNENYSLPWQSIFREEPNFKRFFVIRSSQNADLRKLNIFKIDTELRNKLNGEPTKIRMRTDGGVDVEVNSAEQSDLIKKIKSLVHEPVIVELHPRYNSCQGVIMSSLLKDYSEQDILDGLSDKGVTKVYRMKKKVDDDLVNTSALVLTFDTPKLPDKIKIICGIFEKVRPYIPMPRRCFKCQKFGHVGKFCRARNGICGKCSEEAHEGECTQPTKCINCLGPHPASAKSCSRYQLEKEILAIQAKERIPFTEAKEIAMSRHITPGITYSTALRGTQKTMYKDVNNSPSSDGRPKENETQNNISPPTPQLNHANQPSTSSTNIPENNAAETPTTMKQTPIKSPQRKPTISEQTRNKRKTVSTPEHSPIMQSKKRSTNHDLDPLKVASYKSDTEMDSDGPDPPRKEIPKQNNPNLKTKLHTNEPSNKNNNLNKPPSRNRKPSSKIDKNNNRKSSDQSYKQTNKENDIHKESSSQKIATHISSSWR